MPKGIYKRIKGINYFPEIQGFQKKHLVSKKTRRKIRKSLEEKCRGEKNPNWKGGKKIQNGYILIWKPKHPNCNKAGYIRNSRLIAEKCLSRYLTKIEVIHHINKNKSDNKPENLYLFENQEKHMDYHGLKNQILVSNLTQNPKE